MRPKVARRLLMPEEAIPKFIEEVKKCHCIWNPEDERYTDRYEIMKAWNQISKTMGQPAEILKAKWKNLKDIFKREIKVQRKKWRKEVESLEEYRGTWKFFEALWFIHKPEEINFEIELDEDQNEETYEDTQEFNEEDDNRLNHFVKCEPLQSEEDEEPLFVEVDPPGIATRKRKRGEVGKHDFDMMFLQSLTPFMRKLEPMRKLIVRSKIQDILINELASQKQQTSKNNS